MSSSNPTPPEAVAIVGLAGRFPRARNLDEFWRNLRDGREAISFFADDQVQWLPIEHPPVAGDPRFVRARGILEQPEWFDAAFFGMNPREAAIMDPQHRVFLECAWEALEDAGCNPDTYSGLIGVFAGASMNTYLFTNLLTNPELVKDYGLFSSMIMNDGDFVPTRLSYKLNLRGPSINVQTACSTSLVAVNLAVQSLLAYRCDAALAGGVSITFPANRGQHHLEGGIMSNDGHCRAFDAQASGTVLGDGAGIVVLKRLSEAVAEGDRIYAVIRGTGINNDGAVKIGYTAPSIDGQAECIAMAQAEAGVEPASIAYVEAHGTGTPLGDPIEIAALAKAFGAKPGTPKFCAVGSIKSNIGHLDAAAGVAGLIKTVLALQHEAIPPSLHFSAENPKLELERTPFFINSALRPWPRGGRPRRAGVSSFGIGGTNAHAVIEEAPLTAPSSPSRRPRHLLVLSAKSQPALDAAAANLARHLREHPSQEFADVAFSLQTRRKPFAHRRALVVASRDEAIAVLSRAEAAVGEAVPSTPAVRDASGTADTTPTVAFLFTGQGAQVVGMARELYANEREFRAIIDRGSEWLRAPLELDLRTVLYPAGEAGAASAADRLTQTRITQPALFLVEYALARLWMDAGVKPNAMIGHSLGEYVAACLAGVFTFEDALAIVTERARLMQAQAPGAMLAVRLPEDRLTSFLSDSLSLAATNARGLCVVSGPFDAITALEKVLGESDVASRRLATSHAFHSALMEPVLAPLAEFISRYERRAPQIPFVSNVTGTWITAQQATDPKYWASHVRHTVRFADGLSRLLEPGGRRALVEVGPGQTLAGLARQHPAATAPDVTIIASLPGAAEGDADGKWLHALGQLWAIGAEPNWPALHAGEKRRFVALPTYPFQRIRCWIEPGMSFTALQSGGHVVAAQPKQVSKSDPIRTGGGSDVAETRDPAAGVAPADSLVARLRQLFGELSGLDLAKADPAVSFFQLGFDSLFLTQASLAVSKRFGVDVTFRQLREQLQTFGRLAAHLEQAQAGAAVPPTRTTADTETTVAAPKDRPVAGPAAGAGEDGKESAESTLPLTPAQREIWFASQLGQEVSAAYNESSNLRIEGPLDIAALQRAFQRLVARHEALRIAVLPGGEQQRILPHVRFVLETRDLSRIDPAERDRETRQFIAAELERPFDLSPGPLFRAHLLRLDSERHVIVLIVHHIVCDGWSLGILQKDLADLYASERSPERPELEPAPRFSRYAAGQAAARTTAAFHAAEEFWTGQFADGAPILELPTDRARP
ncbi:MAG TPA: beta-ketoacyl synthase N-terminal-like domain-containing protein, partial [Opitutaceae bacterium]|nr:beta-ketoacyl synthase N-terminal-like domain-containing protein [Opitutaceae bacterium]